MTTRTLAEEVVWLALRATALPVDFFRHVVANPGSDGAVGLEALKRSDVPAELVEPLYQATMTAIPASWSTRAEAVGHVAALRALTGVPADTVDRLFEHDLRVHCRSHTASYGVRVVLDRLPADHPVIQELLETPDLDLLCVLIGQGEIAHAIAALRRLDGLLAQDPADRAVRAAAKEAAVSAGQRIARAGSRQTDAELSTLDSTELLLWTLGSIPKLDKVRGSLSDLAVDRVVLACLAGELRGTSNLAQVADVVRRFDLTWTREGVRRLTEGAEACSLPSARGQALRQTVTASAQLRAAHFERVERLGVNVPQDSSLASLRESRKRRDVADWLVAQLGDAPGTWDRAARAADILPATTPVDEVGAVLRALTA